MTVHMPDMMRRIGLNPWGTPAATSGVTAMKRIPESGNVFFSNA
jgi:hypothetical protein